FKVEVNVEERVEWFTGVEVMEELPRDRLPAVGEGLTPVDGGRLRFPFFVDAHLPAGDNHRAFAPVGDDPCGHAGLVGDPAALEQGQGAGEADGQHGEVFDI